MGLRGGSCSREDLGAYSGIGGGKDINTGYVGKVEERRGFGGGIWYIHIRMVGKTSGSEAGC